MMKQPRVIKPDSLIAKKLKLSPAGSVNIIDLDRLAFTATVVIGKFTIVVNAVDLSVSDSVYVRCDFGTSTFRGATEITNSVFVNCNFSKVLYDGNVNNCKFYSCSFFEAELVGVSIKESTFIDCKLSSTYLSQSLLEKSIFIGSHDIDHETIYSNDENDVSWL